jgi:hypothetical protein
MYAIKYRPTNQFANLTFQGIDALNLGINPKVYRDEATAMIDLNRIEDAFARNIQSNYNGRCTFERNLKMLEQKNDIKVNATRTKNIAFYKMKLEEITKQEDRVASYKAEDFEVVSINIW